MYIFVTSKEKYPISKIINSLHYNICFIPSNYLAYIKKTVRCNEEMWMFMYIFKSSFALFLGIWLNMHFQCPFYEKKDQKQNGQNHEYHFSIDLGEREYESGVVKIWLHYQINSLMFCLNTKMDRIKNYTNYVTLANICHKA